MKVIILAAWKWTRLKPLTNTTPKPLLKIAGKTILEYNLESIYSHVDEIIIVVKYLEEQIKEYIWNAYKWVPIIYHTQSDEKWTWAAIKWLPEIKWDIVIMVGDQIFDSWDIDTLIQHDWYGCLVQKAENPESYGIFAQDESWNATSLIEKPQEFIWNLANISFYKINSDIFEIVDTLSPSSRWEVEITDGISIFMQKYPLRLIEWSFMDIWSPWHILDANSKLLQWLESSDIKWEIEEWVVIKWNIILEKWAILKSGTYIEWNCYFWADSIIGPNAYIRWESVIWEWSKVWFSVELKNSHVGDNTKIPHLSYVWDSVIGNNVNLWGWFVVANLRHDKKNIKMMINGELADTGRYKFGCVIGDDVKTWANTMIYPWRILDTWSTTLPNEVVK